MTTVNKGHSFMTERDNPVEDSLLETLRIPYLDPTEDAGTILIIDSPELIIPPGPDVKILNRGHNEWKVPSPNSDPSLQRKLI
jgi:hypothetical protein